MSELHRALYSEPDVTVFSLLSPETCQQPNGYGDLPLHVAIHQKRSDKCIEAILAAYPEAAKTQSGYTKEFPLALAISCNANEAVVAMIILIFVWMEV